MSNPLSSLVVTLLAILWMSASVGSSLLAAEELTAETVHRLVLQLGDPRRSQRIAAERQLQALGPDILPHLDGFDRPVSPAVQEAVRRVRNVLEREQAERSVRPSRVMLNGMFSLSEVVRQIEEQTQNAIRTTQLSLATLQQPLTVDWSERTYWDCVDAIDQQPELYVRFNRADGTLEIVPEKSEDQSPAAAANIGAFRITVQDVTLRNDFTHPERNVIRVNYSVTAEPRLRPLFVRVPHADFQLSANDMPLAPLNKDARRERSVDRPGPVPLSIDFVAPKSQALDRVSLTGRLEIEVAAGRELFVFRNLGSAEHVVRRRGGVTVTLEQAALANSKSLETGTVRVELIVAYDQGGPAFESHRTWVYHNDAFLRSAEGTDRWTHNGFDTVAEEEAAVKLTYHFENVRSDPDRLEFVYAAPTLLLTVPVGIDLPNIPVGTSVEAAE